MSKVGRRLAAAFAQLDAIYAELPTIACRGKCWGACGPINLTDLEAKRLKIAAHVKPRTTAELTCIYLTAGHRCSVYAVRPLICRAYGLVRAMSCPHGCLPSRWLTDPEFARLGRRIEGLTDPHRQLITTPDGLADPQRSFTAIGEPTRSEDAIERNSERTRSLRALHGGRILCAVDENDP